MKKLILHLKTACITGMWILCVSSKAQTFNYAFSQSTGTYTALSGATTVANTSAWNGNGYTIPVGFSFGFSGKNFDSLTIAPNGLILFGKDNKRAIAAFKGIMPVLDTTNNYSSISYLSANNILKIEYKNVGFGMHNPDNFNFQVWLSQQGGTIEFHTGTTTLSAVRDSLIMPIAGVLNPSMDQSNNGYILAGDPASPAAQTITDKLKYVVRVPDPNTVYTLTPQ